jgi:hypothetical protein
MPNSVGTRFVDGEMDGKYHVIHLCSYQIVTREALCRVFPGNLAVRVDGFAEEFTSWLRYVTSNTNKCVNNMFDDARDVGWLEAICAFVDIKSTRISHCCMKHADRQASEVVPRVSRIMKHRWDASAFISDVEKEDGRGDFKAIDERSL